MPEAMKYPTLADIAEMRSRGYEAFSIARAERQFQRGQEALKLCKIIEDAFTGVTLGQGVGLLEARGLDDYEDAATCAAYRAQDEKEDWRKISAEALCHCNSSLSFFDAEGMRFHLPAYLIAELRGEYGFGLTFCLTHLSDHCIAQFSLLNEVQRKAVRAYVMHLIDDEDEQLDLPHILRALDEYWTE